MDFQITYNYSDIWANLYKAFDQAQIKNEKLLELLRNAQLNNVKYNNYKYGSGDITDHKVVGSRNTVVNSTGVIVSCE